MKKKLLLLSGFLYLTSCKKIYTCECNTTYTRLQNDKTFVTEIFPGSANPYSEKMKKQQAESACKHEEVATQTNFKNAVTSGGFYPLKSGESISTSCSLK